MIEGVTFEAPMDMYISRDRMRYEDYMRMKKILEALARKDLESKKRDPVEEWPKFPIVPLGPGSYPYWIGRSIKGKLYFTEEMKRLGKDEKHK